MPEQKPSADSLAAALGDLQQLVRRLRAPDGCPWDRKQTLDSCRAHLLEEAHEVAAALDSRDWSGLGEELGDLLFQLCFIAELAREQELFELAAVARTTHDKMVARHPHVFGDQRLESAEEVERAWQRNKLELGSDRGDSLLSGVATSLPALTASFRLAQKAAGVGFDWEHVADILAKIAEELDELDEAVNEQPPSNDRVEEELGDLLFAAACLGRRLGVDPERALARANLKFRRRFASIETELGEQLGSGGVDPEVRARMEQLWRAAKAEEGDS